MNLRKEFNRMGHLFHNGVEKKSNASEEWADKRAKQAMGMAQRMRDQVDLRGFVSAEEKIVRHVRENPAVYLMATALVIGALIAKLIIQGNESRRAPLL